MVGVDEWLASPVGGVARYRHRSGSRDHESVKLE